MEHSITDKVKLIVEWLETKKAENISYINLQGKTSFTDAIIVCNGTAEIHNRAIADHVIDMAKEHKMMILGKEGMENAKWILIDLGDVIIHIFNSAMRDFYKMEQLWIKENKIQDTEQNED
ncbi:MAG: ribosome silencing factor [Candidatus Cloacimonetes bacterium]|jgi:ribosome-associated protein|nr:ribosome silencing factor [Candidatus Cloacimonadota bacterium]HPM01484.1 ribosome silencing factor [Candidatus Cloacimonadota bacterium]